MAAPGRARYSKAWPAGTVVVISEGETTVKTAAAPLKRGKPDPDMKVRTALDRAAARIEGKFGRQPLVEASVRKTIGNSYYELGLYPQAQGEFERALDLQRRILGVAHPVTLDTLRVLAVIYKDEGRLKDAEKLNGETLQAQRRVRGAEHPDTLASQADQEIIYQQEGKIRRGGGARSRATGRTAAPAGRGSSQYPAD